MLALHLMVNHTTTTLFKRLPHYRDHTHQPQVQQQVSLKTKCIDQGGRADQRGSPLSTFASLTVSLMLCSAGSNATGESRALEGCSVSSKSPTRVRVGDQGVAGRNGREKYLTDLPSKQINDFMIPIWPTYWTACALQAGVDYQRSLC